LTILFAFVGCAYNTSETRDYSIDDLYNPDLFDYRVEFTTERVLVYIHYDHEAEHNLTMSVDGEQIQLSLCTRPPESYRGDYSFNLGRAYQITIEATKPRKLRESIVLIMPQAIIPDFPETMGIPIEFSWQMYPNNSLNSDLASFNAIRTRSSSPFDLGFYDYQIPANSRSVVVPTEFIYSHDGIRFSGRLRSVSYITTSCPYNPVCDYHGWNAVTNSALGTNTPSSEWDGTRVASQIAATVNNNIGVAGIGGIGVSVMPIYSSLSGTAKVRKFAVS
jgi:hypothetical protein